MLMPLVSQKPLLEQLLAVLILWIKRCISICDSTLLQINSLRLNYNSIRDATKTDEQLSKIMTELLSSSKSDSEYIIDSDVLFKD